MNDELERLRPEVRDALFNVGKHCDAEVFDTLTSELLQLAGYEQAAGWLAIEKAEFRQRAEQYEAELASIPDANEWDALRERAEKAEAELAIAQNTIDAQQDTMGALKRKLALSEGELEALKARITEAPLEVVESLPGAVGPPWPRDHWIEVRMAEPCACVGQGLIGKRVRLVVEE